MCLRHWNQVSRPIRQAVQRHYRRGQEEFRDESPLWSFAAEAARCQVAFGEGKITAHEAIERLAKIKRQSSLCDVPGCIQPSARNDDEGTRCAAHVRVSERERAELLATAAQRYGHGGQRRRARR
jgi:hypothetical protein